MTGDELLNGNNVVHYINPAEFDKDENIINASAFQLKEGKTDLSVNWLECFENLTKLQQLDEIKRFSRITIRKNGRFAELNVGHTKRHLRGLLPGLHFIHNPLDADGIYEADPSHSDILGLPDFSHEESFRELIGDLIASECIEAIHPGLIES